MPNKIITIALAGNPNSGKTTIFNNLTGARQHVGNYPGVTVERKEGRVIYKGFDIKVIDLPGTYSLTAYSPDEVVARNVIIEEKPDVVVNIVDASNLERNLYLTTQLKELEVPLVLALNMMDIAEKRGIKIQQNLLSQLLGVPIVTLIGTKNQGTIDLLDAVLDSFHGRVKLTPKTVKYHHEVEDELTILQHMLANQVVNVQLAAGTEASYAGIPTYPLRWLAVKLLENDREIVNKVSSWAGGDKILVAVKKSQDRIREILQDDPELVVVDGRYGFIRGACQEAVTYTGTDQITITEKIDKVLLNRVVALPIFLGIMWLLFQLTFTIGTPLMEWIEAGFVALGEWVASHMNEGLLRSLIVDGIIGGVGGVVVFLPNIILLFLGIAFLEATGYMARAAFVMDKIMHRVGLHGKSFVPMLTGFGCNIPAIMATRTLENPKDRLVTILVTPFMSCGARLPVYSLLIAAFFAPEVSGNVLFSIYLIGILMAMLMAKVFKTWLVPGESEPFVMELPIYRMPTLKNLLIHMWERAWLYLKKAGTIILAASILIWGLFTFPTMDESGQPYTSAAQQMEESYAGRIGKAIEPVLAPLGFDWKTSVALVAGFAAKEVVVSTMGTLYSIGDEDALAEGEENTVKNFAQKAKEQSGFTPFTAYILMLFTLLYSPCIAAIAVIKRETNGWKWPLFTVAYTTGLAWIVCFLVYQSGKIVGLA